MSGERPCAPDGRTRCSWGVGVRRSGGRTSVDGTPTEGATRRREERSLVSNSLSERHSRRKVGELTIDLRLRQPLATHHHTGAAGEIADALQWIRVEQDEVGAIPRDDRPEPTILLQYARYVSSNVSCSC